MAKENFILVSLDDPKTKKLAQTISNESCKKILNYLAEKEATESELADKLMIPISTVHYNLQQLTHSGLVLADEYHYSQKGKEINHYKLANKYVIIAPKSVWGLKEKLKSILPVAIIVGGAAAFIGLFKATFFNTISAVGKSAEIAAPFAAERLQEGAMLKSLASSEAMADAAQAAPAAAAAPVNETVQVINQTINQTIWPSAVLWFVIGAASAIVLYLAVDYIRHRLNK